jgi:hypothetical protein
VTYERLVDDAGPWVMDVIRIERRQPEIELQATLGHDQVCRTQVLTGQLPEPTPTSRPVAAVNGDFFVMTGEDAGLPIGFHVSGGHLIRTGKGNPTFAWSQGGRVAIVEPTFDGSVHVGGDSYPLEGINQSLPPGTIVMYTPDYGSRARPAEGPWVVIETGGLPLGLSGAVSGSVADVVDSPPELRPGRIVLAGLDDGAAFLEGIPAGAEIVIEYDSRLPDWTMGAVSGGPVLCRDGQVVREGRVRHPRTAVGFNDEEVILFAVDGRQPGWSIGMSYDEMSPTLLRLGCTDAMNLDGGGSTTVWVRGEVTNRPSDGGLRRVANGLAAVLNGPIGPPAMIATDPPEVWGLPGARVDVAVEARDAQWNAVSAPIGMRVGDAVERVDETATIELDRPGRHSVELLCGEFRATLPVHVQTEPTSAALDPPVAVAMPGDEIRFRGLLLGPGGQALAQPADAAWRFSVPDRLGSTNPAGVVRVGEGAESGQVMGECMGVSAAAEVRVAEPRRVRGAYFAAVPEENGPTGTVESRNEALVLSYELRDADATRAAYARFDAEVGRAIGFTAKLKAEGSSPWVRLAYVDGNGTRVTETLADRLPTDGQWHDVRLRLADGTKAPVTLQSIYVVETDPDSAASGALLIDDVQAWVLTGE